jgi:hypothetical protein
MQRRGGSAGCNGIGDLMPQNFNAIHTDLRSSQMPKDFHRIYKWLTFSLSGFASMTKVG